MFDAKLQSDNWIVQELNLDHRDVTAVSSS